MNYHNPENLTDWGQSDGWRLLTTEEAKQPLPDDAEFFCEEIGWGPSGERCEVSESQSVTYRTKKPLPASPLIAQLDAEIKALEEKKAVALAVEAGAEWEVRYRVGQDCWHKAHYELEWYLSEHRAPIWQVRLKPKPVMRRWSKPEDVPGPVCWLTQKDPDTQIPTYHLVNLVCKNGVYVNNGGVNQLWGWSKVVRENRYSTDRINWKPCETTEEAK